VTARPFRLIFFSIEPAGRLFCSELASTNPAALGRAQAIEWDYRGNSNSPLVADFPLAAMTLPQIPGDPSSG
jgi:hypothetical protein